MYVRVIANGAFTSLGSPVVPATCLKTNRDGSRVGVEWMKNKIDGFLKSFWGLQYHFFAGLARNRTRLTARCLLQNAPTYSHDLP